MRIAIDARELIGRPTGVGRYLNELLREWDRSPAAAPHDFILCAPEPPDTAGLRALRVSTAIAPGSGTSWEQRVLPRLVSSARTDVLFAPAYTCPLWCRAPVALVIHDVSFAAHPEWFSWREGLRRRTLTWLGARRAARVITESDFSRREIARLLGIDPVRIEVIPLGVSALHRPGTRAPLVLYVGSLFDRRHIPELVEGFRRMAARVPHARLDIVGDNRTRPRLDLERLIAASGISDRIRFRSYVPDAELASLYGSASAFAFLSDYEGFGLTPLEAMAAGVPIVALDTEVAREIYGPAALYLERPDPDLVAAALERLLVDESDRARLTAAGSRQIQQYSWQTCASRTLDAILAATA